MLYCIFGEKDIEELASYIETLINANRFCSVWMGFLYHTSLLYCFVLVNELSCVYIYVSKIIRCSLVSSR